MTLRRAVQPSPHAAPEIPSGDDGNDCAGRSFFGQCGELYNGDPVRFYFEVGSGGMRMVAHSWVRVCRSTVVLVAVLAVAACVTAEGPPGKSQGRLDFESNICNRNS